jgi:hypothetical protein
MNEGCFLPATMGLVEGPFSCKGRSTLQVHKRMGSYPRVRVRGDGARWSCRPVLLVESVRKTGLDTARDPRRGEPHPARPQRRHSAVPQGPPRATGAVGRAGPGTDCPRPGSRRRVLRPHRPHRHQPGGHPMSTGPHAVRDSITMLRRDVRHSLRFPMMSVSGGNWAARTSTTPTRTSRRASPPPPRTRSRSTPSTAIR